uniref:Uncharacterized protein n=1 Tax=Anguilla anguilla TaxID=7936 RepID=A0A0E9TIJ1_ANGAN
MTRHSRKNFLGTTSRENLLIGSKCLLLEIMALAVVR